jgi:hypothetical protein
MGTPQESTNNLPPSRSSSQQQLFEDEQAQPPHDESELALFYEDEYFRKNLSLFKK